MYQDICQFIRYCKSFINKLNLVNNEKIYVTPLLYIIPFHHHISLYSGGVLHITGTGYLHIFILNPFPGKNFTPLHRHVFKKLEKCTSILTICMDYKMYLQL